MKRKYSSQNNRPVMWRGAFIQFHRSDHSSFKRFFFTIATNEESFFILLQYFCLPGCPACVIVSLLVQQLTLASPGYCVTQQHMTFTLHAWRLRDVMFEGGGSHIIGGDVTDVQTQQGLNSSIMVRFGRFKRQNPLIEGLPTTWAT